MKNIILLWMVAFAMPAMLLAHQGTIKGGVYNAASNAPLVGANIKIISSELGTSTDEFGTFKLTNLPGGSYTIEVSYLGFESQSQSVILEENESVSVKLFMAPTPINLSEVNISSNNRVNLSVINALDIKLKPVNNSQDVLRNIPGLFIAQHAGGGKAEQIFLRGFDIDHGTDINLSADGMPVNMVSHAHGQGYSDLHFIIPETIERVNFEKGPYYAQKGDFTTAGYAEFKTMEFLERNMVKIEAGDFNTYRTVGMFKLYDNNRQQAYIASEINLTDGYFESPQNFHRINLLGKYTGFVNENNKLSVQASILNSRWDASGQIPLRAVEAGDIGRFGAIDDTEGGQTQRINLSVKSDKRINDRDFISNQIYFINYNFELYSNFTFFLEDSINGDQIRQKESRNIYGYNGSYNFQRKLGNMPLNSEVGMQLRFDQVDDVELSHTRNRSETLERLALGDIQQLNAGFYINENLLISKKLRLNLGARFDYFDFQYQNQLEANYNLQSESKGIVSPKAGLFYQLTKNVEVFAKAGTGFHSNDARVVVAQGGNQILPRAYGGDVGTELKLGKKVVLQSAVWILDLEQEFVYVGDAGIVEPSGYTRRVGIDASVRAQLLPWLYADADVNNTKPRSLDAEDGEDYIPLAPTFTTIGGLSYRFKNGINGSLRYRYLGDRAANEDNSVIAQGYFLMDAQLNYTTKTFEIGIGVQNILNEEWREAQFDTESRLAGELAPVSEIHFTPGAPRFVKAHFSYFF